MNNILRSITSFLVFVGFTAYSIIISTVGAYAIMLVINFTNQVSRIPAYLHWTLNLNEWQHIIYNHHNAVIVYILLVVCFMVFVPGAMVLYASKNRVANIWVS